MLSDGSSSRLSLRRSGLLLLLAVVLLVGAGCGGSDDGDDGGDGGGAAPTATTEPEADPVAGGSLVYGIEAESDGWNPTTASWSLSGLLIGQSVYDPLAAYDVDGVAQPYLAESFDHNDDYTEWTITLRNGVRFHNGDPLTADAVVTMLEGHRASGLTSPAFAPIEGVEASDERTVVVTMSSPWVVFPTALTGQTGVVPHPSIIDEGISDAPVGTGPFEFEEWVPDSNWTGVKNDDYWREGLPYLESIEFRPLNDPLRRVDARRSGDVDVIHTSGQADLDRLQDAIDSGDMRIWTDTGENEEGSLMLNNSQPPFDDVRMRQAVAYATDQETYNTVINQGLGELATGPFTPTNPFAVETDYPTYDLERAQELVAELEAEGKSVAFTLTNTTNAFDREQSEFLEQMYEAAGFDVTLEFLEFAQFIGLAVSGNYQALAWRQFSSPDPDGEYQWWYTGSSLNFAQLSDEQIDAALDAGRSSPERADREQAYADLQNRMAEIVPFVWFNHVEWFIVADASVHDIPSGPLPDGQESLPFQAGAHRTAQIWRD
jgi:ABC-type transport system substrate-binding protein